MATKPSTASTASTAAKKTPRATRKTPKPQAESAPVRQTRPRKPSVAKAVAKAIEASPVGKAGAVTSAMLRTRRAGLLSRRVRNKHVVVTGATSGIGEDCALKLAAAAPP